MSVTYFILSSVCISLTNICIEWFIVGFLFQIIPALAPNAWKPEDNRSYGYRILLSLIFGVIFTIFYIKVGSKYVLPGDIWSHCKLGLICFACFGFILEMSNAIYINNNKKFVVGKLVSSSLSYMAAAIIAGEFYFR
jgi:hypothetical protein